MSINDEFLKEFKKLDKLLSDKYGEIHGVTAYINKMKECSQLNIEFKKLKNLRNVRNKLIHEVGYDETERVTKEDIMYIKNFYHRFLNGKDPLAQIKTQTEGKNKWLIIAVTVAILFVVSVISAAVLNHFM